MRYFIDTANVQDIQKATRTGYISGMTLNPVLLAKETSDYRAHVQKILGVIPASWEISCEVKAGDVTSMVTQARELASWDRRVRVKLPTNGPGLEAASQVLPDVRLNMTIVKSVAQGLLCRAVREQKGAGDMILSVFCGRLRQAGHDWIPVVRTLSERAPPVGVLAASIKTPSDLSDAVAAGAHIVTAPLDVYEMCLASPLVDEDVNNFNKPFESGQLSTPARRS